MSRERTREVLDKLGIPVEKSDAHGIWIKRTICPSNIFRVTEAWRLHTGGGIAGNSDKIWLAPKSRKTLLLSTKDVYKPRGPYSNKAQLEKALRAWRRGE